MLLITGARRGGIVGLQWDKVNFEDRTIQIIQSLQYSKERGIYLEDTKTFSSRRIVSIPEETVALLQEYRRWQLEQRLMLGDMWHGTGFVFTQEDGKPIYPDSITAWLNKFSKRHNLPHIHPHESRDTIATQLLYGGENTATIAKMLGHSRQSITQNFYQNALRQSSARAAETATDIFLRGIKNVEKDGAEINVVRQMCAKNAMYS